MLKKILVSFIICALCAMNVIYAQPCTPDPNHTTELVYPDTIINLLPAYKNSFYQDKLTVNVPADTVLSSIFVKIDSFVINQITNLPPGISLSCNPISCTLPSPNSGCMSFSGTPTNTGTYPMVIDFTIFGKLYGTIPASNPFTFTGYKIIVNQAVGVNNPDKSTFKVEQNNPNPFIDKTEIVYTIPANDNIEFNVYNMVGEVVYNKHVKSLAGENKLFFQSNVLPAGIYFYKINNAKQSVTKRMIVSAN